MSLRSFASAVLLPPSALALTTLVGLLISRRLPRLSRLLLWASVIGLIVLAMPITGGTLLAALEVDLPLIPPASAPPQAIVVLGGDLSRGGRDGLELRVGPLTLERLLAASALQRRTNLPILVSGGSLHEHERPIAAVMADTLADDFRVPVRWIEPASVDTWDNARMSAAILRQDGIRSIYVVTQAWHMRRAMMAFAQTGLTVTMAPTRLDRWPALELEAFLPELAGWEASYFALHEWIGCAFYALR